MHRVSFIFHLNVFLVSVCTRGFGYLLCRSQGRGIGLVCTRRFSFHEFYNFLLFNFFNFSLFVEDFFLPTTFSHTHGPRPLVYPRPTTFSYTLVTQLFYPKHFFDCAYKVDHFGSIWTRVWTLWYGILAVNSVTL